MILSERDRDLVEQAVKCINDLLRSGFNDRGEAWIKAWYSHDLKWSEGDPKYVTIPRRLIPPFIELARRERVFFDLACFVICTRSKASVGLPDEMRTFAGEVQRKVTSRPSGRPGRPSDWGRNFIIIRTMKEINPGILFEGENARGPTANVDQRGARQRERSAMEIVYVALQRTKIGLVSKESINGIWVSTKWQTAHDEAYSLLLGDMLDDLDDVGRI